MAAKRSGHTASLLSNGQVLVAGGINSSGDKSSCELYTPATGSAAPSRSARTAPRVSPQAPDPDGSTATSYTGTIPFGRSDGRSTELSGEPTLRSINGTATLAVNAAPFADHQPDSGLLDRDAGRLSRADLDLFFMLDPLQQDEIFIGGR
jgi:hypothetical protein